MTTAQLTLELSNGCELLHLNFPSVLSHTAQPRKVFLEDTTVHVIPGHLPFRWCWLQLTALQETKLPKNPPPKPSPCILADGP